MLSPSDHSRCELSISYLALQQSVEQREIDGGCSVPKSYGSSTVGDASWAEGVWLPFSLQPGVNYIASVGPLSVQE